MIDDVLPWLAAVHWTVQRCPCRVRPQDYADVFGAGTVALLEMRRDGITDRTMILDTLRRAVRRAARPSVDPIRRTWSLDQPAPGGDGETLLGELVTEDRRLRRRLGRRARPPKESRRGLYCGQCDRWLPVESFWRCAGRTSGRQAYCKTCSPPAKREANVRYRAKRRLQRLADRA